MIRLGIVGCGNMMRQHIRGVSNVENVQVTAFADVILGNAGALAEDYPGAYITTDFRTMADYVDAVLIALPHDLHYECGMYFARRKKHILMEKPLCNTEEECLRLIETCEEEGVVLMCAYPLRYRPGVLKMKELADSGRFGRIMQMSLWTEQLTKYEEETHWGRTARLGGGQFFSHGCHYVDLLLWFLGQPLQGMHFGTNLGTPWMLREGTSIAGFKFANGALGYHGATWGARGTHLGWNFQLMMEKGLLEYDKKCIKFYNQNVVHDPSRLDGCKYEVIWQDDVVQGKQTQYEIRHFVDCILTGKKPNTHGRNAMKSLQVIWKMYDAEKFGVIADLRDIKVEE